MSARPIEWTGPPEEGRLSIAAEGAALTPEREGPTTAVLLRPAAYRDVNALHALLDAYARQGLLLPRTPEQISRRIHEFTVAVDAHGIVGCGALRLYTPKLAELVALAVAERAQGQGIGRVLVDAIVDEAEHKGVRRLFALTLRERFFNRLGFQTRPMHQLPEKLAADCALCPKRHACNEILVLRELGPAHCN